MSLIDCLLGGLPDGEVTGVQLGLHLTAVVAGSRGAEACGLASTVMGGQSCHGEPDVPQAGQLETRSGRELAALARSGHPPLSSVGVAALNALLPTRPESWVEANAEEILRNRGAGKTVALVGHFPFASRLRPQVGELIVLEQKPQAGDVPASTAAEVLPRADVIAITAMTLVNHTLEGLLALCPSEAFIMLVGPSTPLSPVLFDYGVDLLCGSVVTGIAPVLHILGQGGTFRQVRKAGVQLVTMAKGAVGGT